VEIEKMSNEASLHVKKTTVQKMDLKEHVKRISRGDISVRLKLVILEKTEIKRRFPVLESLTKIPEETWRSWWRTGKVPKADLVEAACRIWPEYAYWVATGMTDIECGHNMPKRIHALLSDPAEADKHLGKELSKEEVISLLFMNNWPEGGLVGHPKRNTFTSEEYFNTCMDMRRASDLEDRDVEIRLISKYLLLREQRSVEIQRNFEQLSFIENQNQSE
jgi:hypothetical protein